MRSVKHSMMRRRRWLPAAFCLLCCLLFSGCTPGATVDSLLKPPSLSKEQQQIYLALQDAVGSGITLQYPRAGANLSAFTVVDLDNDGEDEALVFYKKTSLTAMENGLRLSVLDQVKGEWMSVCDRPADGTEVERIVISPMGSEDSQNQIFVGYSGVDQSDKSLTVYRYSDSEVQQLFTAAYTMFDVADLDGDQAQELLVLGKLTENTSSSAAMYRLQNGTVKDNGKLDLRTGFTDFSQVQYGRLEDGTTGYIVCNTFGAETLGHFTEGTQAYDDANLWVVDLRQNGGGDVYAVTQTLGVFLGEGTMVYLRDGEGAYFRYVSQQDRTTLYPTIVLTSGGTASSAEIFSLAMKDKNGGMVIGSNTFGKGVAQVVLTGAQEPEALTDGDALRITAYQYYGVSGNTAQNIGVIPDLLVDTNHADEIASLFSVNEPWQSTEGWLRVHLGGWRWYIDLSKAMGEEMAPYFAEMLSALPPAVDIFVGDGEGWVKSTPAQIAADTQVKGYAPRVFSDVAGTKCELAANTLCTYGMLRGYADGTFHPDNGLTRAELCALLTQTMRLHLPETGATFSDVAKDSWYAPYIQAAQAAGYVSGVGNGRFDPQGKVTQEQMMTVLGRLAADLNLNFLGASNAVPEDTGISSKYSTWAQPWVWLLEKSQKNILGQPLSMLYASSDSIDPKAPATRGQTAQILYTLFTAVELLKY
mgnify:CR=1 FL=1